MKQKEVTKTFMMILNLKKHLIPMVCTDIFQRCKHNAMTNTSIIRRLYKCCCVMLSGSHPARPDCLHRGCAIIQNARGPGAHITQ